MTGPSLRRIREEDVVSAEVLPLEPVTVDYTAPGATTLTTNANSNLVAKGADTFTYDQANRLTSATVAGVTETYTYDGDGVRFSRQVGAGPVTRYVSDVNTSLPVILDDGTRKNVWGLGLAYAVSGTAVEIYHTDRLGSVLAITHASGAVTATYRTDEYGVPTAATGTSTQPFGFTGEPHGATGLSYLRARYYDPSLGRFMTRDVNPGSAAISLSTNRCIYALNRPTSLVDPSGLSSSAVLGPADRAHRCGDLLRDIEAVIDELGARYYDLWKDVHGLTRHPSMSLADIASDLWKVTNGSSERSRATTTTCGANTTETAMTDQGHRDFQLD